MQKLRQPRLRRNRSPAERRKMKKGTECVHLVMVLVKIRHDEDGNTIVYQYKCKCGYCENVIVDASKIQKKYLEEWT
uniref:Uncharacterized protein n=1 Tax=uncultured marine virus TaxID=186617 RepID=A0A0F7L7M4_9VIRU|nr:hypothetical protein [uncultured marine virus]